MCDEKEYKEWMMVKTKNEEREIDAIVPNTDILD